MHVPLLTCVQALYASQPYIFGLEPLGLGISKAHPDVGEALFKLNGFIFTFVLLDGKVGIFNHASTVNCGVFNVLEYGTLILPRRLQR